jgi:hypothetical protein
MSEIFFCSLSLDRLWDPPDLLHNGYTGVKRQKLEADYSPPSNAEVKNFRAIPSLPYASSWHDDQLITPTVNFKFHLPAPTGIKKKHRNPEKPHLL